MSKRPFRIELSRQKNGLLLMKKETKTHQNLLIENHIETNTNNMDPQIKTPSPQSLDIMDFENEENLEIGIEKWANYYEIDNCARVSLNRLLKHHKQLTKNIQILNDGNGGLKINIKSELLQTIVNDTKNHNNSLNNMTNDAETTNTQPDEPSRNSGNSRTHIANDDILERVECESRPKKRRLHSETKESEAKHLNLSCHTIDQFNNLLVKCKNDHKILEEFRSLMMAEKQHSKDFLNYIDICLRKLYNESLIVNLNATDHVDKHHLSQNFLITEIEQIALKLFPELNESDISTTITNWFSFYLNINEKMDAHKLRSLLHTKLLPMFERNEHKIYENTLIKLLNLPCKNINDFYQMNLACEEKQNCQKLCMIILKQSYLKNLYDFIYKCLQIIFMEDLTLYNKIVPSIKTAFVFEIIQQCTVYYFENATGDIVQNVIFEYFEQNLIEHYVEEMSSNASDKSNSMSIHDTITNDLEIAAEYIDQSIIEDEYAENEKSSSDEIETVFHIPCDTLDEIKQFSSLCITNTIFMNNVQNFFLTKGDPSILKFIPNCLNAVFSKELATSFSWTGLGVNKLSFQSLYLLSILLDCVNYLFPRSSNKEREKIIMNWFRNAPKRLIQAKKSKEVFEKTATIRLDIIENEKNNDQLQSRSKTKRNFQLESHIPCKIHEEMDMLNNDCMKSDNPKFKALARIFLNAKHKNPRKYAKKCLEMIFSPVLATQYNWSGRGRKQKHGFCKFPVYRLLKGCFQQLYKDEDAQSFEKDCVKFFKYTTQRLVYSLENSDNSLCITDLCGNLSEDDDV